MKIVCPACERIADIRSFRIDGATLVLECDRCGTESRLSPPAPAQPLPLAVGGAELAPGPSASNVVPLRPSAEVPALPQPVPPEQDWLEVPPGHCPKCVAPRRGNSQACAQCGLVFDLFQAEEQQPSGWLVTSWKELVSSWERPEAHERFVQDALLHQELLAAGRLYRIRLARQPNDAMAMHGRDALVRAASNTTQLAQAAETERLPGMARRVRTLAIICTALFFFALLAGGVYRLLTTGSP